MRGSGGGSEGEGVGGPGQGAALTAPGREQQSPHHALTRFSFAAVKVKKTLKNLTVVETQDAVFSLELTHKDVKGAQWVKNGVEIPHSDKYEIISDGTAHTLKIKNCTSQDESVYSFRLGKLSANARLNVESKQH